MLKSWSSNGIVVKCNAVGMVEYQITFCNVWRSCPFGRVKDTYLSFQHDLWYHDTMSWYLEPNLWLGIESFKCPAHSRKEYSSCRVIIFKEIFSSWLCWRSKGTVFTCIAEQVSSDKGLMKQIEILSVCGETPGKWKQVARLPEDHILNENTSSVCYHNERDRKMKSLVCELTDLQQVCVIFYKTRGICCVCVWIRAGLTDSGIVIRVEHQSQWLETGSIVFYSTAMIRSLPLRVKLSTYSLWQHKRVHIWTFRISHNAMTS